MQTLGRIVAAEGAPQKTKTTRESKHGQRGFIDVTAASSCVLMAYGLAILVVLPLKGSCSERPLVICVHPCSSVAETRFLSPTPIDSLGAHHDLSGALRSPLHIETRLRSAR